MLLGDRPEVADIDWLLAVVDADEADYLEWMRDRRREHAEAVEAHHAAVDEAIRTGKPPPQVPEVLPERDHMDRITGFATRRRILHEQRQRAVAAAGPEVEEEARKVAGEVLAEARVLAETLTGLAERVTAIQQTVTDCRAAQAMLDRADPSRGARQMEPLQPVDAVALLAAALHGGDLLAAQPARRLGFAEYEPEIREIQVR